jgi:hypothetical protein
MINKSRWAGHALCKDWIDWRNLKEGREQLKGSKYKWKNIMNHVSPPPLDVMTLSITGIIHMYTVK